MKEKRTRPLLNLFVHSKIVRIALAVFVLVGLPVIVYRLLDIPTHKAIIVERGEQKQKMLVDGTRVTLDAGSVFRFPSRFGEANREVFLNGEGYFEAMPDKRPFVVNTVTAKITVLGTHFNIRAWHQNQNVVVTAIDGSVSLRSRARTQKDEVVIQKGQFSILARGIPEAPTEVDINESLAWLHHEMDFKDVPLREVLEQLERWYDLEIKLSDTSLASNRVSVRIQNRPIAEILEMMALLNNFNYAHKDKKVLYSPNKAK